MKIRNKILIYFSSTVITLTAVASVIIYILFSEYREESFQQRQKQKIEVTINLLKEYQNMSEELTHVMDNLTIHDFYDEKMMIFDSNKLLIYSSVDDLSILQYQAILNNLSPATQWIETKEDTYDLIGVYVESGNKHFYALSKAYDESGYTKLHFLRNTLILITILIAIVVFIISYILSKKISKPITNLANQLTTFDINNDQLTQIENHTNTFEIKNLTEKFNQLIERTNETFSFQKHTVHHISHQLKTPIAILVSELERIVKQIESHELKSDIEDQIVKTKSLGNIINSLLEISKIESGKQTPKQPLRIDELIFDIIDELNIIYPDFHFEINYSPKEFSDNKLEVIANLLLIKQAFQNILSNSIIYNDSTKTAIVFDCTADNVLKISISNSGTPITPDEEKYLFNHFFRGNNSLKKTGFGLGLVLAKKIFEIHAATITYSNAVNNKNTFEITFPLS